MVNREPDMNVGVNWQKQKEADMAVVFFILAVVFGVLLYRQSKKHKELQKRLCR